MFKWQCKLNTSMFHVPLFTKVSFEIKELFFLHSLPYSKHTLLIITTLMHNIKCQSAHLKLFKVSEIPRLILTLFDVCRIEEELGDKARFAGKNFRRPI